MTNADKIRTMNDEQLARFLWIWKINSVTAFLTQGGMNSMNAKDMREWVGHPVDTFVCTETFVGDEYVFDQDFNIKADHKTENSSEKPNNCEHITEDGVTCAKYPACDDCLDNPLNKVKGSERLVKGSERSSE